MSNENKHTANEMEEVHQYKCHYCHHIFDFGSNDIVDWTYYPQDRVAVACIKCPNCGETLSFIDLFNKYEKYE
jgi:hypothetical protein|nr:MAG TPA: DNA-directed RNA polymerase subunit [Caudoviricetes sp.]